MTRSDAPATYDDDFYAWTQAQAAALRLIPRQTLGPHVDIEHVAEEIEDLGKRDLREVKSYLERLIEHLIKIDARPRSRDRAHWRSEAMHFQRSAVAAYTPSMRQLIDVEPIWISSAKLATSLPFEPPIRLIAGPCPFELESLLASDFDINAALCRIASAKSTG